MIRAADSLVRFGQNNNTWELGGLRAVENPALGARRMPDQILVLVAEDEDVVRVVVVEALHDAGFAVMDVEHAGAALEVLHRHAAQIHVLFTDIQMPGAMDGLALAHHTAKHWPSVALLIASGGPHPERAQLPEKSRYLAKPYEHQHVVRHIRELVATA